MENNLKTIVLDLIDKQEDITLAIGENEYYMENDSYSVTVEYLLEIYNGYYDLDALIQDGYSFKILSINVVNNIDNIEQELCPDKDLEYTMFVGAEIESSFNDYDITIDDYLENNF